MEPELTLQDYLSIARRRVRWWLIPFVLIFAVAVAVAVLTPPLYRSTGTILVESQQIPDDLIKSTVTSYADERIELIKQRVMTRERLLEIDRKFGLSKQVDENLTASEIVDLIRSNIKVELVSADVGKGRRGRKATIAFRVSYENRDPVLAQRVANELVTLFLDENAKTRTQRASETTEFLAQEAKRRKERLDAIEEQISSYKQENSDALPEHLSLHMGMLERAESDLKESERDIKATEQERRFLQIELASVRAGTESTRTGSRVPTPAEQLAAYKLKLSEMRALYKDNYPGLEPLEQKIIELQKGIDPAAVRPLLEAQLTRAQRQLAEAKAQRKANDPEVRRLGDKVASIQREIDNLPKRTAANAESTNPAEARVLAQIAAADSRIKSLEEQKKALRKRIESLQAAVMKTPQVERALNALERDRENALRDYESLRAKEAQARLAENLEEDRKAERFSLLEPPALPDKPVKPNRKKMVAFGFILALTGGGGGLMLAESMDRSIRGPMVLTQLLKQPPLAHIPYITTEGEIQRNRRRRKLLVVLALILVLALLAAVHYFYMPLNLLLFKIMARLG